VAAFGRHHKNLPNPPSPLAAGQKAAGAGIACAEQSCHPTFLGLPRNAGTWYHQNSKRDSKWPSRLTPMATSSLGT